MAIVEERLVVVEDRPAVVEERLSAVDIPVDDPADAAVVAPDVVFVKVVVSG
jgi:hypothetical protein